MNEREELLDSYLEIMTREIAADNRSLERAQGRLEGDMYVQTRLKTTPYSVIYLVIADMQGDLTFNFDSMFMHKSAIWQEAFKEAVQEFVTAVNNELDRMAAQAQAENEKTSASLKERARKYDEHKAALAEKLNQRLLERATQEGESSS